MMSYRILARTGDRLSRLAAGAVLLLGLSGCSATPDPPKLPPRVVVIGIDQLSAELVEELAGSGKLPTFARILREGAHAELAAPDPLEPMQLWNTALTGKGPATHQVIGEYVRLPSGSGWARTPSSARKTKTLLQMVGDSGHSVLSVGVTGTWPAEVVNGIVLANGYRPSRWTEAIEHSFDLESAGMTCYPPTVCGEVLDLVPGVEDLPREELSRFFTLNEQEFRQLYDESLGSLLRHENPPREFALTLQSDRSNLAVAERLAERYRSRLVLTELELAAATQPAFWVFSRGDVYDPPRDSVRRLGHTVEEVYAWLDARLGEVLESMPASSTLVVFAPCGFGDGQRTLEDGSVIPYPLRSAKGHLWMVGQGVARGVEGRPRRLEDLVPTVLALLDLDVGEDLEGSTPRDLFDPAFLAAHPVTAAASYDLGWDQQTRYPPRRGFAVDGDSPADNGNLGQERSPR